MKSNAPVKQTDTRPFMEELERRLLLSADVFGAFAGNAVFQDVEQPDNENVQLTESDQHVEADAADHQSRELIIVDATTPDYESLVADLTGQAEEDRIFEVAVLDPTENGVDQITNLLSTYTGLDAVHIISHGDAGGISLGNGVLDYDALVNNARDIEGWGDAFNAEGDLLIYGCNLAASEEGRDLVDTLGRLTETDVAASEDLTGHASLGGDWDLEYRVGQVEADVAISLLAQENWQATLQMQTGSYVGDGTDARGITGLGFQPDFIIIKSESGAYSTVVRTSSMVGDATKPLVGGSPVFANGIESLDADGFTLGTDGRVNAGGETYHWTAFSAAAGEMTVGSYMGDGTDNRSVAGFGFQADYAIVMGAGAHESVQRFQDQVGDVSLEVGSSAVLTNVIQAFEADGLQIGSDARVNQSGQEYYYVAWKEIAGKAEFGSYTGDGTDDRNIAGVGFEPDYAIVKIEGGGDAVHRFDSLAGDNTLGTGTDGAYANGVQQFSADGFQVGNHITVNWSGQTYYYAAFNADANTAPTDLQVSTTTDGGLSLNEDGGNDAYLIADNGGAILGGLTELTAEVRFAMQSFPNSTNFFSYATSSDDNVFKFNIRDDGDLSVSINSVKINSSAMDYRSLADGQQHTLSVTWNSAGGLWEMFVDGVSTDSGSGLESGVTLAGGGTLVMGNDQDSVDGGYDPDAEVAATLYDARIFNDVRAAGEIAANYDQTLASTEPGMVANWTFNDLSTGGVITDAVSGNNLTVSHASGAGFVNSDPTLTMSVAENATDASLVGTVTAIDPDVGDTFTYTLLDDAGGRFAINGSTGEITVAASSLLDFETAMSHNVTVRVTDSGSQTYDEIFSIAVTNVNDAATFGVGDGIVETDIAAGTDSGQNLLVQPDGRTVVVGTAGSHFFLARYNVDGTLDDSFGTNGIVTTTIGDNSTGIGVAIQPDGKLVMTGYSSSGGDIDLVVARYDTDGSLDSSFGSGGIVTTNIAGPSDFGYGIAIQPDGKIVVSGMTDNGGYDVVVVRFESDGSLDTGFGTGGVVIQDVGSGLDVALNTVLQPDGQILVSGYTQGGGGYDFMVARFDTGGTLDATFGAGGVATVDFGMSDVAIDMVLQSDGKIIVVGNDGNDVAVARLTGSGALDPTFGTGGMVTTSVGAGSSGAYGVALQTDGYVVVSGMSSGGAFVARYDPDGNLDPTFGTGGVHQVSGTTIANDVAIRPDGSIVMCGSGDAMPVFVVDSTGNAETSFDIGILNATPTFIEGGAPVVLDGDVTIFDAELSAADEFSGATLTIARNGGASGDDVFSATGNLGPLSEGTKLMLGASAIGEVTTNSGGQLVLSFESGTTQANIDEVLQSIAYANNGTAPASVVLDWTFNDGNSGAQGSGGALQTTGNLTVNIAVNNGSVLFVVGDTALSASDLAIQAQLLANGYGVTVIDDDVVTSGDAAGQDLVLISETVNSGTIESTFTNEAVPVMVLEPWALDGLGMTGATAGTDYGEAVDTDVDILDPGHYLAAGLSNTIAVYNAANEVQWGAPNGNAIAVASLPGSPSNASIFAYEAGANMPGLTAPARRLFFFVDNDAAHTLTTDGWALFNSAIEWAQDQPPVITSNGAGATANINIAENTTAVTTVTATDADPDDTFTYSIAGGADAALFSINSSTGELSFLSPPNYEEPADADSDNVYEVTVQVTDSRSGVDTQAISVTITDVVELVVTNTDATGTGSLHEAILNANANVGVTDTITFNVGGGGPQTIMVDPAGLPIITDSIILDATTQPGYSGAPLITLDGSATPASSGINGITLRTNDSTVRGFIVINFADEGIEIDGSTGFGDNNTIQNNWVGIDKDGNVAGNAEHGIMVSAGADGNLIGGTGPNQGNVVSGNGFSGLIINKDSNNNVVEGNIIGLLADGMTVVGNGAHGVLIETSADGNRIGGSASGAGNIISGNNGDGIYIDGTTDATYTTPVTGTVILGNFIGIDITGNTQAGNDIQDTGITINESSGNTIGGSGAGEANVLSGNRLRGVIIIGATATDNDISGNFIGTNADGSAALTNIGGGQQIGVYLFDAPGNTIGGTDPGAGNVISGNITYGIYAWGANATGNRIQGNIIGLDASQTTAIGNGNASGGGILLSSAPDNLIGGTVAGSANVISGHLGTGVAFSGTATGNTVLGNEIYDNGALGIDLSSDGVTANDADDVDTGANNLQNFPVITFAELSGTDLTLSGSLDTDGVSTQYRIEFYGNAAGTQDATNGEARVYLGSTMITTDGSGDASFSNVTLSGVTLIGGDYVTATATRVTDPGQIGVDDVLAYGSTSEYAANLAITLANLAPTDLQTTATTEGGLSLNEDGGNDAYFLADNGGALLGGLTTVTIEVSFSISTPATDVTPLMSYADGANDEELALFIKSDGRIWFGANSNGTPIQSTTGSYNQLFDGEQHHVAVSWDSSTGAVVFYVDGSPVESFAGYQTGATIAGGGELIFGQDQDSVLGGFNTIDVFSGVLYDVRIFDDVRTAGEVSSNYDITLPPTEAGMIANWTFNDLSTTGVVTDSVSGNNLTEQHVSTIGFNASIPALTFAVHETAANGTVVGNVAAIDPNVGDTFTYSLVDNAGGRFAIDAATGEITIADTSLIDFESATSHNITVRVTDSGSLTYDEVFTISVRDDNDAPEITSNGGGASASVSVAENTTAVTTVTADDDDLDTLNFSIIGGVDAAFFSIDTNTGVLTFNSAPDFENALDDDGNNVYEVTVQAADGQGGFDTQAISVTVTDVDEIAPVVTVNSISTADSTPQLGGTVDDPTATVQVTVNGSTYTATNNGDGTWTLADNTIAPALADGTYDVSVTATDGVGNVGTDVSVDELVVDTTAPVVTVTGLSTSDNTPQLTGTVSDPTATVQVTVNGTTYTATNNGDGTWTLADNTIAPALADGTYDVSVTATDAVGNVGTDASIDELVVDTTAPVVTVTGLTTADNTPALTGTVSDPTATVQVTVNGTTYTATNNGDGTWTLADDTIAPALADGTYDVSITATDGLGNVGTDASIDELIVDTTAPVVTVLGLTTADNTPALTGSVCDPTAAVQVMVDGITYTATNNGDGTWTLADNTIAPALLDGTYDVSVTATDGVGNVGTDASVDELVVDTTAPVVTVTGLATADNTPALTGTVSDPTATVQVTVNGTTYTATNNGDGTWTLADNTIAPALADGTYDVSVNATDGVGNVGSDASVDELVVDTTAPVVTVTGLSTSDNTPQLTGTVSDPSATVQVTVNASTYTATNNGDGTWTLADNTIAPALADGTYDVSVTATDAVGNVGTDASIDELVVDTTAPVVTVTGLTTADNTPALTGTVSDPAATVQVTVNGTTYTATNNGDGTWTLADNTIAPALADGTYDVSVTATDGVGNVGTDASVDELVVDTTAPVVTVTGLSTSDNTPQLTGTVSDPTATVQVTVNGTTYTATNNGDGTWTLADNTIAPALADGTYDVSVTATDGLGNVGTDGSIDELVVDTTAPIVTVTGLATADNTPALTGTVSDPTATVQVTVNGTTYTATNNGDGTWTLVDNTIAPALADGTYDVSVTATDSVGNVGTDGSIDELVVDTTAPVVTVTGLTTADNTPAITGTVSDPTATVQVTVNGTTYTATNNGDGTWTLADNTIAPALADGTYDLSVSATDAVGNVGTDASIDELIVDTTAPVVTVTAISTSDATPQLMGTVSDPAATIQVTVNGTTYTATNNGDGTWTLADDTIAPALADGTYDVSVTATDGVGNVGTDASVDELVVDTTAPIVTVTGLATADNTPALTGTVSDPTATVQVMVDGMTYIATNNGDGTWTLADDTIAPALADGTYDVSVTATDGVGNVGTDGSVDELTVDTTAPVVTVTGLTTADNTPALTGTVSDPTATVQVTVDGTIYTATNNGDGTWTLADDTIAPALADGTYDVSVTATDGVGNVGSDASVDELIVDTSPPVVTVTAISTSDATPQLTGTVSDPTAAIQVTVNGTTYTATNNGDGTWTLADDTIAPALADGAYDVSVTATDGVGNVGTDASIDELVVDTTAPVVTVTGLTTADNTPALTGTVSDPTATVQVTVNGTTYAATNNGDGTWTLADDTIAPALAKGTYDVSVTATDGVGNVGTDASVDELVIQNSPPIATDDAYTTDEDLAFTAVLGVDDLLLNDSDPDGDPLTVNTTPVSGPTNGALILNSDGTFTYTPNANFNGTDSFVYEISDGDGGTAQATVTLTVNPINDPPTAVGDSYVTNEDQSVVALLGVDDLLMNDSDPEGDPLTVNTTPVALPTNGSLILNNDGTFTYTPDPDFSGMDSFIYEVLDGNGGTSQATVTIVVNPVNDAPTTTGIADVTVNEDALDTIINLVASFDDVEDGSGGLNFAVMQNTNPALFGSTNVDNVAGTLTLDYAADAFGTADLTVRATDSNGAWVEATFTVTVNPVNDAPVIAAENISVDEDVSFVAMLGVDDLLLNDSDVDGDALSVNTTPVAGPGNGSVLLNSDGTFTYTPNANFNGSDSFIYEVTDGNGGSGQGVVNITINPINDLPVAAGEAMAVDEDAALSGVPGVNDLLLNDTDVDGDPLSVSTTPVTSPANGTLVLNSDGTFTYTPNANFNGADSFAYQITDGNGGTSQAIVNISVNPVNDAPIAGSDAMSVVGGVATSFSDVSLLANDADVDGDALSIVGFTQPADGTLVQNPDGSFTYTPSNGFAGVDSFSYTVADASGAQDTVMVLINVTPPVDPGPDPDPGPGPDDGGGTTDDDQDSDDPADNDTGDEGSTGGTGDTDDPEAPPAEDGGGGGAREANPGSPAEPGIWSEYLGIYGPDGADRNVIASATPAKYLYDALQLMDRTFEIEVPDFALANSTYVPIWQALDAMKREMRNPDGDEFGGVMVLQMATGTSVALSAGFVAWILRGGALASALMSVLPMWQGFDPLPILMARKRRKKAAQQKDLQDAEILRESEVDRLFEAATKAGLLHRSKESS